MDEDGLQSDRRTVAEVPWNTTRPQKFLQGPQSRWRELVMLVRAFTEMLRGFRHLHFVGPCITVFGSARFPEGHRYYQLARRIGAAIVAEGFTVMTGGGPGIMEAANRGRVRLAVAVSDATFVCRLSSTRIAGWMCSLIFDTSSFAS